MRKDHFIYGGVDSRNFGVGIYGDQLANPPERDEEHIEVPGKNGDVIIDNGRYKNQTVPYKAYIINNYNSNIMGLRNALISQKGYQRLEDSINPDEFRMAKALPFEVEEVGVLRAGQFTIAFNCKPQRYLKDGEIPIEVTATSSIYNFQSETALPLIRAYGTGSFTIGGVTVQINSANGYTDLDCELQEAYKDTLATNCNGNIVLTNGKFPSLAPGANTITLSSITKLVITPRWWRV